MAAARVVLSHLTVPWETLFRGLESVDEKDVALLSMIPDAEKQQIKLTLEAKNLNAMLSYHRKLQENPTFKEVSLGEHEIVQQDPYRPVRFSVTATWVIKGYASK
jgi:Tfp pilus assembly protein PilN